MAKKPAAKAASTEPAPAADLQRPAAEVLYADELDQLQAMRPTTNQKGTTA